MSTHFWIRPLEPLYAGRPSSIPAGESSGDISLFPPPISAFQGMIRTKLLLGANPPLPLRERSARSKQTIASLVGESSSLPDRWQLEGPFPVRMQHSNNGAYLEPWLPTPRFVCLAQQGKRGSPRFLVPIEDHTKDLSPTLLRAFSDRDAPCVTLGLPQGQVPSPAEGWCSPTNLLQVLAGYGEWQSHDHGQLPPFVRAERQARTAIEYSRGTALDEQLAFLTFYRFEDNSGLLGWCDASLSPPLDPASLHSGVVRLGRGGRIGEFSPATAFDDAWQRVLKGDYLDEYLAQELENQERERYAWVVLMTPVRLSDPRQPSFPGLGPNVTVVAAVLGPPLVLGGYDMVERKPRSNQTYVPAGSCWLVRLGGTREEQLNVLKAWHMRHPLGPITDRSFGFGLTVVGLAHLTGVSDNG